MARDHTLETLRMADSEDLATMTGQLHIEDEQRKRNKDAKKQKKQIAREKAIQVTSSSGVPPPGNPSSSRASRPSRPTDTPQVQLSKALSYILRHGAAKEGLPVRSDGYVSVAAILDRPKISKISMPALAHDAEASTLAARAPTLNDIRVTVSSDTKGRFQLKEEEEEVFIRAVQGHSLQEITSLDHIDITLDNLSILSGEQGTTEPEMSGKLPKGVEILHGTTFSAWEKIKVSGGLSKMGRNHIHLAKGRPNAAGVISGMRASSPVIIHIDMLLALQDGIPFALASNGAVLTSGHGDSGILNLKYFKRVEETKSGKTLWEP